MKEWMELVDYKITEGSDYGWSCFGPNSYQLSNWNGVHGKGGYSFNIVFSTKSHKVYSVEVCDYTNDCAYRMINPDYEKNHSKEAKSRDVSMNQAWDDVGYVDLEVDDDFIEKCLAIKEGTSYDTRIQIPVDFSDEELLRYMKLAHDRDMTFNAFVGEVLRSALNNNSLENEIDFVPNDEYYDDGGQVPVDFSDEELLSNTESRKDI